MAPSIVDRIFGQEYMESAGLVSILAWTLIFIFITFPIGISLGVSGNQKYNVIAVICGSTANIIMNYVFIGFWGITGVAISTVLTAAIIFVCSTYFFKKVFKEIFMLEKSIGFLFICSIIFAGLQYLLRLEGVADAVIFDGIFFLVVFAFKMIDSEDRAIFLQVIRFN
jgi:O-antigen/teichoic acid export membrane protein